MTPFNIRPELSPTPARRRLDNLNICLLCGAISLLIDAALWTNALRFLNRILPGDTATLAILSVIFVAFILPYRGLYIGARRWEEGPIRAIVGIALCLVSLVVFVEMALYTARHYDK
jgi:hypothetical protein